jgi:hypothetical protein
VGGNTVEESETIGIRQNIRAISLSGKFDLHRPALFGLEQVCHHRKHIAAAIAGCYRVDANRVRFPLLERFPGTLDGRELEGDMDLAFECG